jgi:hypothetical protein
MLCDDPPAMLGDERVSGGAMLAQCLSRAGFRPPPSASCSPAFDFDQWPGYETHSLIEAAGGTAHYQSKTGHRPEQLKSGSQETYRWRKTNSNPWSLPGDRWDLDPL